MIRFPLIAAVALALGACNAQKGHAPQTAMPAPRYASLEALAAGRPEASPAAPERAATPVVVLPAWIGRPRSLREHADADVFEQAIGLDGAPRGEGGRNVVLVTLPRSGAGLGRLTEGAGASMGRPSEATIRGEIETAFPGLAMQVVTRPSSNAYGPYGLAVGRGSRGARCLYAWQWIEDAPAIAGSRSAPVSLRVRLCRDDISLEAMAAAVNQIRLLPRWEGEPVAAPARVATGTGGRARPRPSAAPRRIAVERQVAEPVAVAQAPRDTGGRRYLGDDPGPLAASRIPAMPVDTVRRSLVGGVPSGAGQPGAMVADLPPEAYRGPAGGRP